MKKLLAIILCISMIFTFATGCGQDEAADPEPQDDQTEIAEDEGQETAEPEEAEEPEEPEYKFTFDPKALSGFWKDIFGETKVEAWYRLVDAALKGEDTFECPDQETFDWVIGQFPEKCFPVLGELIGSYGECENGVGHIYFLTSRKEFKKKLAEFTDQVEDILNKTMKEDYTDMEKALSLYRYFYENYEYDYDTYEKMYIEPQNQIRCYRLFEEGTGICQEIATAYSFLLTQAGVNATIMMGTDHTWSYVKINGKNYHIDPTFVLDDDGYLGYFMMTDEQRDITYPDDRGYYLMASNYTQEHEIPAFSADDDTFSKIWDTYLVDFDHDKHTIRYFYWNDQVEREEMDFDYEGF
ncbi:MAG: transglutaminase domain-containing protein [Firmicutes bacterium]|nr:transglutaminase domain-containing protein [Bacillota bacterium]